MVGGADTPTPDGSIDDADRGGGDSAFFLTTSPLLTSSLFTILADGGVVDLLTSGTGRGLTGVESDLLTSGFFGVVGELLTSSGELLTSTLDDGSAVLGTSGGVVDLLTSDNGATGSVGTYLEGSETVEHGGGGGGGGGRAVTL